MTTTWQPIETAPKDGREVLLKVKWRAGISGKCLVGHFMRGGHCIDDHPPIEQGWYFWNGCMFDKAAEPTHWAELPEEPTPATAMMYCDYCDGCGWYEGGKTLNTKCEKCRGTGVVPA